MRTPSRRPTARVLGALAIAAMALAPSLACSSTPSSETAATRPGDDVPEDDLHASDGAALTCATADGTTSVDVAGEERSFAAHLPAEIADPVPAIVLFHGFGSAPELILAASDLDVEGPRAGVAVVAPQGAGEPSTWGIVDPASSDAAFVDMLLDDLAEDPCIDADRVWLAGHSAGSAFSGVYGCTHTDRVAGLWLNAGLPPALCPPAAGVEVVVVHGTADPVVPFEGGPQAVGESSVDLSDVPSSTATWAERAGCEPDPEITATADAEVRTWTGCGGDVTVSLAAVDGAGHEWPGRSDGPADRYPATCVLLARVTAGDGEACTA